ncbi:MAG: tail fiber protein [Endozoicomonas sp.]|uniref:tail fiber protein n=1 Tax=Endozoicomonas sp. TaxID=1892382 RepID=UPI003D9AF83E
MSLTIHQSGIDAAINAQANGFDGVKLNRVDLYNGSTKIKSLNLTGVQVIEPGRIYVVAQDSTTDAYDVQKMEFYTDGNVKFATAQNADSSIVQSKAVNSTLLLAHQLVLSVAPGTVAPSGDVSIFMPQATEALLGGAEIATQSEVNTGTDHTRFVTPKTLKSRLSSFVRNATETVKGFLEIATQSEVNAGTDHTRAVTPKTLKSRLMSFTMTGDLTMASGADIVFEDGHHRITNNDGLGNFNLRVGHDSGEKYTHTSGAIHVEFSHETASPAVLFHLSSGGQEKVVGDPVSWAAKFEFKQDGHIETNGKKLFGEHHYPDWSEIANKPNASTTVYGQTKLNSAINSTSEVLAANSKAVKTAYDAGTRSATESQKGQVERATQSEVNTGTDDIRYVSPKKLKAWGAAFVRNASESIKGFIEIATQAEVDAGTDDVRAVTPKKMRFGLSYLFAQNGFIIFPGWLGSWVVQWGAFNFSGNAQIQVFFPTSFIQKCYGVVATQHSNSVPQICYLSEPGGTALPRLTDFKISSDSPTANSAFWISWGK